MENDTIKKILRAQSWQRAKGEMFALLETFFHEEDEFNRVRELVERFVELIEDDATWI